MSPISPKKPNRSRPDLASELVHDILKKKLEDKQRGEAPKPSAAATRLRRLRLTLLTLLPVFLGFMLWNLTAARQTPVVFSPAEMDAGVRFKMFLAAQALRTYRDSTGRWPASLDAVGFAGEGLEYDVVDTSYVLTGMSGEIPFTHRAGEDLAFFRDASQDLLR